MYSPYRDRLQIERYISQMAGGNQDAVALLYEQTKNALRDNTSQNPDNSFIGTETAKKAAFSHAGVSGASASEIEVELTEEDGKFVYKIEFKSGVVEYEYEIDAAAGAILEYDSDEDD